MNQETTKAIYMVHLISGENFEHIYEISAKQKEAEEFIEAISSYIGRAFVKKTILAMNHPLTIYNPNNITCIEVEFKAPAEFAAALENATPREMGFPKQ